MNTLATTCGPDGFDDIVALNSFDDDAEDAEGITLIEESEALGPARQFHGGRAQRRLLEALVLRPDIAIHQVLPIRDPFGGDHALAARQIAHDIKLPHLHLQGVEPAIVTHPVAEQVAQPGDALPDLGAGARDGRDDRAAGRRRSRGR